jgi:hypothetical protein
MSSLCSGGREEGGMEGWNKKIKKWRERVY